MDYITISRKINREIMRMERYRTNHILHLLFSVLTAGFWVFVWLLVTINNANERMKSQKRIDSLEMALNVGEME